MPDPVIFLMDLFQTTDPFQIYSIGMSLYYMLQNQCVNGQIFVCPQVTADNLVPAIAINSGLLGSAPQLDYTLPPNVCTMAGVCCRVLQQQSMQL